MHDAMKAADDPQVVAENLIEAATSVSPRRRYTCGKVARQVSVLSRFVPERMFDKVFASRCVCLRNPLGSSVCDQRSLLTR
jgi:hypothetical protein